LVYIQPNFHVNIPLPLRPEQGGLVDGHLAHNGGESVDIKPRRDGDARQGPRQRVHAEGAGHGYAGHEDGDLGHLKGGAREQTARLGCLESRLKSLKLKVRRQCGDDRTSQRVGERGLSTRTPSEQRPTRHAELGWKQE
jgi:hypothetical protein